MAKIIDEKSYQITMLKKSEYEYFACGAENIDCKYGMLSINKNFEKLPAGLLLHNITISKKKFINSIDELYKEFYKRNSNFFRAYIFSEYEEIFDELIKKEFGIKKVYEVALSKKLDFDEQTLNNTRLIEVKDEKLWEVKKSLYILGTHSPDGHNLDSNLYCDFEKIKTDLGYMKTYIYYLDGKEIATVSLSLNENFARIKNLFIIPEFRKKGYGRDIVLKLMNISKEKGANYIGVYAIENSSAHKMYQSCGMKDLLKQIELYKEF